MIQDDSSNADATMTNGQVQLAAVDSPLLKGAGVNNGMIDEPKSPLPKIDKPNRSAMGTYNPMSQSHAVKHLGSLESEKKRSRKSSRISHTANRQDFNPVRWLALNLISKNNDRLDTIRMQEREAQLQRDTMREEQDEANSLEENDVEHTNKDRIKGIKKRTSKINVSSNKAGSPQQPKNRVPVVRKQSTIKNVLLKKPPARSPTVKKIS